MLNKVVGLARLVAVVLAIVGAFTAIPNAALALLLLGIIAGWSYGADDLTRLVMTALGLGLAGPALGAIPEAGSYLTAIFASLATAVVGAIATVLAVRFYNLAIGDLKGLGAK